MIYLYILKYYKIKKRQYGCTYKLFTEALIMIGKSGDNPTSINDEKINKMWYMVYPQHRYYLATYKKGERKSKKKKKEEGMIWYGICKPLK